MKESKLHWLAGMIDADGSIYITVQKVKKAKFGFYMGPKVHVTGSDHEEYQVRHRLFRQLADELDASWSGATQGDTWSQSVVSGKTALAVLEELLPYLREKKPIAERILEENWSSSAEGMKGRSEEQWRSLVQCREEIESMMSHSNTARRYNKDDLLSELGGEV